MYICNIDFIRNYQRIRSIVGKMFNVFWSCKTKNKGFIGLGFFFFMMSGNFSIILLFITQMLLSMLLFLLSNSCFWRNNDHYMHKEFIHACEHAEGPDPEMILSDHNTKRHFSQPYPSFSLFALLYRQLPDLWLTQNLIVSCAGSVVMQVRLCVLWLLYFQILH